jgi:hypothetical protein
MPLTSRGYVHSQERSLASLGEKPYTIKKAWLGEKPYTAERVKGNLGKELMEREGPREVHWA